MKLRVKRVCAYFDFNPWGLQFLDENMSTIIVAVMKFFTYLIADSDGQESFDGDCNDEDEYGDQTSIFDVIASSVGKTSDHPNLFNNLNESDLLEEDFISKSFLKVYLLFSVLIKWTI